MDTKYEIELGREKYLSWEKSLSKEEDWELPLFLQSWWLDSVVKNDKWSAVMVRESHGEIVGALPFFLNKRFGLKVNIPPFITPYQGPIIKLPPADDRSYIKERFKYWEITEALIKNLPRFDYTAMQMLPEHQDWLPFYWSGYKQYTRYTFTIEDISDPDLCFENFKGNIRTNIRKAQQQLTVVTSDDVHMMYDIHQNAFIRQNLQSPLSEDFFQRVYRSVRAKNKGQIFMAVDGQGEVYAGLLCVHDAKTVYFLISGVDTEKGNVGALSLVYWKAIQYYSKKVKRLDFEGTMLPNVAPVFLSYGARLTPYLRLYRFKNKWLEAVAMLSGKWKA